MAADLVVPVGEIWNLVLPAFAVAHQIGRGGQAQDGPRDGPGQIERQQHGDGESDREDEENVLPPVADRRHDVRAILGQHQGAQHLAVALHRHGDGEHEAAAPVEAHHAGAFAGQCALHLLVVRGALNRRLPIARQVAETGQPVDQIVIGPRRPAERRTIVRRRQLDDRDLAARPRQHEAVGDQLSVRSEDPGSHRVAGQEDAHQAAGHFGHQALGPQGARHDSGAAQGEREAAPLGAQAV
jgi:hypothetical protein